MQSPPSAATNPTDDPYLAVSAEQSRVVYDLVSGLTVTESAQKQGISRSTIHRWLRRDAAFSAVLNSERQRVVDEVRAGIVKLLTPALRTVEEAVQRGDAKTALAVLRSAGVLDVSACLGPVNTADVEFGWEARSLEPRLRIGKLMNG